MRLTVAIIFLLIVSACARNDRMSVIGNWESDISGVKFSVQIAKNLDAENDLLSAKVNGVTVNYAGSMRSDSEVDRWRRERRRTIARCKITQRLDAS